MAATAVAAGTGSPAGTESAEGGPGAAAALELWLNKATDPSMAEQDWSAIQKFCEQVNTDPSGPTHAPWLLAHKIQSPQEKEALYALTVLEICMNHCGEKFHSEVAKFRFLNELIKVLSPKYLGAWATEKVKGRVIEILFSWTVWFPEDIKIRDAYQMLKKQGIIKQDPKLPMDKILPPPSPWPKSIFDADEEKSKLLTRLLKSNHPEDLQAANRLIKNLVKEPPPVTAAAPSDVTHTRRSGRRGQDVSAMPTGRTDARTHGRTPQGARVAEAARTERFSRRKEHANRA